MNKLAIRMVLMGLAILAVAGCLSSQAGDEPQPAATGQVVTVPATTVPVTTVPVTTEPAATGEVMPEGSDYTLATATPGAGGGIADALGGGRVVIYERSGGFAGVMEKAEIYRDGRVVISEDGQMKEFRVPGAQVGALLNLLEEVDYAQLERSEPSSLGGQGADRFTYRLTVVQDGNSVKVSWTEGQSGVPAGLLDVVVTIQELIRNAD
jgi:hypothetical protein